MRGEGTPGGLLFGAHQTLRVMPWPSPTGKHLERGGQDPILAPHTPKNEGREVAVTGPRARGAPCSPPGAPVRA